MSAERSLHIMRHAACDEPGYLCQSLDALGVGYVIHHIDQGDPLPARWETIAGMIFLGAPVSVYDPLPWVADECTLIREAAARRLPMFGICFGAQLMSAALGGRVCSAPHMQIGWHPVHTVEGASTHPLPTELPPRFEAFEWHGDTFTPPSQATPLFRGGCIAQQGFVLDNSLAVQFHPEVTAPQIESWLNDYQHCLPEPGECVQSPEEITHELDERLERQRMVTDRLLAWWLGRVEGEAENRAR